MAIITAFPLDIAIAQSAPASKTVSQYGIPAGDLASALEKFSTQSGLQLVYEEQVVSGKRSRAVQGNFYWSEVLDALLRDSGLEWSNANDVTVVIRRKAGTGSSPVQGNSTSRKEAGTREQERHPKPVKELEQMVVVGSRLGDRPSESALPVRVISREEIERSGAGSIAQVLSYLPEVSVSNAPRGSIGYAGSYDASSINATSVQLRGLPLGTTLILIDGRRAGETSSLAESGLFDLSTVPLAMVERIEVLPAGSSAVYGGDGLAGVINIVLRRDAEALEVRLRGLSADGYNEQNFSGTWGKAWSRGSVTATAAFGKSGTLTSDERSLTADQDFRRFGGLDGRTTSESYPATIYSMAGCPPEDQYCFVPLEERGDLPGLDSPFAIVPSGQDGSAPQPAEFTGGERNVGNQLAKFKSPETNSSVSINGNFRLSDDVEVFADAFYSKRETPAQEVDLGAQAGEYGLTVIPAYNPFNPFGVDVGVDYRFPWTGFFSSYTQNHQRMAIGARGDWRSLRWELAASTVRDRASYDGRSAFDSDLVAEALRSSDPQTALNFFTGDGTAPGSRELLQSLLVPIDLKYGNDIHTINGFVRGSPWRLPAGDVYALVGAEYQKSTLKSSSQGQARTGGQDASRAIFAEVRAPILSSDQPDGKRELMALTGAIRHESLDRSEERAHTSTLGLEVRPTPTFLVRATYSTAFKPIVAYTTYLEPYDFFLWEPIHDPKMGGMEISPGTIDGGGIPPGLRPETSSNATLGFVWTPGSALRASVTGWRSQIKDKFLWIGQNQEAQQFIVDNEENFPGRVIRNSQTGIIEQIDTRQINVASTTLTGADIAIDGRFPVSTGQIIGSLGATYTHSYEEKRLPDSPAENKVSVLGITGWAPRWKIVPRVTWQSAGSTSASVAGRYVSRYNDTVPLQSGANAGDILELGDFWILDLSFDIQLDRLFSRLPEIESARARFNVNNVTNRLPSFCNSCFIGYDATQYDIVGRSLAAEIVLGF